MEAMSAESTSQQISTLWACSNAAPEPKCFSKNIPRGIFEDRRDTGGGVVSATPPPIPFGRRQSLRAVCTK